MYFEKQIYTIDQNAHLLTIPRYMCPYVSNIPKVRQTLYVSLLVYEVFVTRIQFCSYACLKIMVSKA